MEINKKILTGLSIVAILVAIVGAGVVSAKVQLAGSNANMAQQLANKLNISSDKVNAAFSEIRKNQQAEMLKVYEQRLEQAVKDGQISSDQKEPILVKSKEIQGKLDVIQDDVEKWAHEKNIDQRWIMTGRGMGGRGFGGPRGGCFGGSLGGP